MNAASATLQRRIEDLYAVFAHYQLHPHIDGCPCCVGDDDQRRIRTASLRALNGADLQKYAFKALTTWGNTDDLRHFLPRLFELQATSQMDLVDSEILFGKLTYGQWHTWPQPEQHAIHAYFAALWLDVLHLHQPTPYTDADDYLCAIAQAVADLAPYLASWAAIHSRNAYTHLNAYMIQNWEALLRGKLSNPFWEGREAQMHQVVQWIYDPAIMNTLEMRFFTDQNTSANDELAAVIDALHQLHTLRELHE